MNTKKVIVAVVLAVLLAVGGWYAFSQKKDNAGTNREESNDQTSSEPVMKAVAWKDLSTELQTSVKATWEKEAPTCITDGFGPDTFTEPIYTLADDNYATVPVGCDGGSLHLFVKTDGAWTDVEKAAEGFACATVEKHKVPHDLLATSADSSEAICMQADGSKKVLKTYLD